VAGRKLAGIERRAQLRMRMLQRERLGRYDCGGDRAARAVHAVAAVAAVFTVPRITAIVFRQLIRGMVRHGRVLTAVTRRLHGASTRLEGRYYHHQRQKSSQQFHGLIVPI
jgi:hypothetical protein